MKANSDTVILLAREGYALLYYRGDEASQWTMERSEARSFQTVEAARTVLAVLRAASRENSRYVQLRRAWPRDDAGIVSRTWKETA